MKRLLIVAVALPVWLAAATVAEDSAVSALIAERIAGGDQATVAFYESRRFAPAWDDILVARLLEAVDDAQRDGLHPADYEPARLRRLLGAGSAPSRADRDVLATEVFISLARHLLNGRVDPQQLHGDDWIPFRRQRDLTSLLADAVAGDPWEVIDRVRPQHREYRILREALSRILEADTGTGGLVIRGEGRDVTNRDELIELLSINLERWRWLPDDLGATHLLVDIPSSVVLVREDGETIRELRAVVGRARTRTPVLSDTLRSITFNPTWGVPRSLVAGEIFPAIRSEGVAYLAARRFTVFHGDRIVEATSVDWSAARPTDFGFIQQPGPMNPMGRVKFNTTNEWDIYLHDTNQPDLLQRERRTYSAGCVRVEGAVELAGWMLRHWSDWQPEDIERVIRTGEPTYVAPRDRWDIHLVYMTVRPDDDQIISVHPDVYGHDRALREALRTNTGAWREVNHGR